ncbi:AraC family transcriptional regulator [Flavobacterium suaedae]|uniref:AraC family transcriptional regulator n=1 Tax=Flavobacterium suaedae TaxID=1767027 RepID=A0ABQ1JM90_9FLAO|nr:helix-turn-helix transcriptional regulator [Flavobacterium suaedae]GGB72639.1 AraC family transcriptional regulator [Flavobacterium suaedae]
MEAESLQQFYSKHINKGETEKEPLSNNIGHFNVFKLEDCLLPGKQVQYSRRDYYKVSLITGNNRYHYADKSIEIDGTTLIFFNPQVPYTWEALSDISTGFFCIFTTPFFSEGMKTSLDELPMFTAGGKPSYILNSEQKDTVTEIFKKMMIEIKSDYAFKYDLIRSYLNEIIHMALKTEPSEKLYNHPNANSRITSVFKELLERQFPIETPAQRFNMRSASDFASDLGVHVNHLNRAVKNTTGKTTTTIIAERIIAEAKALLKHTNWNISEISNSLGFEEASHFNNFFKKQTSVTPTRYRTV